MRLIDADRLLTERMKSKYYHLPNGDIAIPIVDIEHAPTIEPSEWIPCSEREPNEFEDVLVCLTDGTMDVVQLTDYIDIDGEPKWCHSTDYTLGGAIRNEDVIAWMPLPKPYSNSSEKPNNSKERSE